MMRMILMRSWKRSKGGWQRNWRSKILSNCSSFSFLFALISHSHIVSSGVTELSVLLDSGGTGERRSEFGCVRNSELHLSFDRFDGEIFARRGEHATPASEQQQSIHALAQSP